MSTKPGIPAQPTRVAPPAGELGSRALPAPPARPAPPSARTLALAALGIVYGDIGTSPLYALRECFHGHHAIACTPPSIMGVLSLIVWSLVLVISIKYLVFVLRADNHGEGGILALMALVCPPAASGRRQGALLVLIGLFGAALLYGDGAITPAISVLSAVEGLAVAGPGLGPAVLPVAIAILLGLFLLQRHGTARVGALFGPVTLIWFVCLAALGVAAIARAPGVLAALGPQHAVRFFMTEGRRAFLVLGSVFLVVTGGEALYADMGHFGRRPIRQVWFAVVLPALLLNYLGQGALLLERPELAANPFYHLAPRLLLYPLVGLATAATVIASQAVITGAFSLTWQAVQLGYLPRLHVVHTSEDEIGQIFIPQINTLLLLATVGIVLGFRTSSHLAAAYGIAVTSTMVITTILTYVAMRHIWRWSLLASGLVCLAFVVIDLGFFGANLLKVAHGGWFPLLVGVGVMTLMTTWNSGRRLLMDRLRERSMSFAELEHLLATNPPVRVPGTAVYLTSNPTGIPPSLWGAIRHLKVLHEHVVLLRVETTRTPFVPAADRMEVEPIAPYGLHRATARYGFVEKPNIPRLLDHLRTAGVPFDANDVTYIVSSETLLATDRPGMAIWREKLFAFLSRNAARATEFFRLPPDRVLEIGTHIEL
jgi:KUP system potassium uptake protein